MTNQEQEKFQEFQAEPQEALSPVTAAIQPKRSRSFKKALRKGLGRTVAALNVIIFSLFDLATIVMPGLLAIGQGMNAGKTTLMVVQEGLGIPTKKILRPEMVKTATILTGSFLAVGLQAVAVTSYFIPALVFLAPAFFLASIIIGSALATYDLIKKFQRRNDANKDYPMGKLKFQSALARASFAYTALAVSAVLFFLPGAQIAAIAAISILAIASALMVGFRVWKTLKRHRERSKVAPAQGVIEEAEDEIPAPALDARAVELLTDENQVITEDISLNSMHPLSTLDSNSNLSQLSTPQAPSSVSTESCETSFTQSQSSSSLESITSRNECQIKLRKSASVSSFFASSSVSEMPINYGKNFESKHPR